MAMSRERFITAQADVLEELFGLAPGEDEARWTFEQLALDTHDAMTAAAVSNNGPFHPYPSAFNFADYDRGAGEAVSDEIRARWRAWQAEYLGSSQRMSENVR